MKKAFIFHKIIQNERDICNLSKEKDKLRHGVASGRSFVVYGRRDTGKSSLVKTCIIPYFQKETQSRKDDAFTFFVDLMDSSSEELLAARLGAAFENACRKIYSLEKIFREFARLRPVATVDEFGKPTFSFDYSQTGKKKTYQHILQEISTVAHAKRSLLVFDEFQDIKQVPGAEGVFRDFLQNLSEKTAVIVMGSKKHLLAEMFGKPSAPLAGWGHPIEILPIPYNEFTAYMNDRFAEHGLHIPADTSTKLQDLVGRIPEPVNIICQQLIDDLSETPPAIDLKSIEWSHVESAIETHLDAYGGFYESMLGRFTASQQKVFATLAKHMPVKNPTGSEFLDKFEGISQSTVGKIIKKFEEDAIVYLTPLDKGKGHSVEIASPLLALYARRNR